MGEEKSYTAQNPGDAVREYIFDCLQARRGVGDLNVEVLVVEQKLKALAEFQVLKPDIYISHTGFYQASVVIEEGID